MKQLLITSFCLVVLASCSSPDAKPLAETPTESASEEAITTPNSNTQHKVECKTIKEDKGDDNMDPGSDYFIEDACTYRNMIVKTASFGDAGSCKFGCEEGTYFKLENGQEIQTELGEFFKNKEELLKKINEGLKENFIEIKKENEQDQDLADCFEGVTFEPKSFENLRLAIGDDYFAFNAESGISLDCYGPIGSEISFTFDLEQINAYLSQ